MEKTAYKFFKFLSVFIFYGVTLNNIKNYCGVFRCTQDDIHLTRINSKPFNITI